MEEKIIRLEMKKKSRKFFEKLEKRYSNEIFNYIKEGNTPLGLASSGYQTRAWPTDIIPNNPTSKESLKEAIENMFIYQNYNSLNLRDIWLITTRKEDIYLNYCKSAKKYLIKEINEFIEKLFTNYPNELKRLILNRYSKKELFMAEYTHRELGKKFDLIEYLRNRETYGYPQTGSPSCDNEGDKCSWILLMEYFPQTGK